LPLASCSLLSISLASRSTVPVLHYSRRTSHMSPRIYPVLYEKVHVC
jgi:hypothetical protein